MELPLVRSDCEVTYVYKKQVMRMMDVLMAQINQDIIYLRSRNTVDDETRKMFDNSIQCFKEQLHFCEGIKMGNKAGCFPLYRIIRYCREDEEVSLAHDKMVEFFSME